VHAPTHNSPFTPSHNPWPALPWWQRARSSIIRLSSILRKAARSHISLTSLTAWREPCGEHAPMGWPPPKQSQVLPSLSAPVFPSSASTSAPPTLSIAHRRLGLSHRRGGFSITHSRHVLFSLLMFCSFYSILHFTRLDTD
jgi:hypothetical protein